MDNWMEQNMDILRAMDIFGVKENELKKFGVEDTFNPPNRLYGFMCTRADHRYGSLVLFQVNGQECEQIIYGTPKLHYPFDKNGTYIWPDVREARGWDKLDGTNVLAYTYWYGAKKYITYKTRLTPVIQDSQFNPFRQMWLECLDNNSWIERLILANENYNLSFELFGFRNQITIKYDASLDVKFLFGVRREDSAVKPPDTLILVAGTKLPTAFGQMIVTAMDTKMALTVQYNRFRENMSELNKDGLFQEGMVIYAHVGEPSWVMFKCKPEEIEKIHWAASGSIPTIALKNTALNAFEDNDTPTVANFETLLLEEYSHEMINKSSEKIKKAWSWAMDRMVLTRSVNFIWAKAKEEGFDIMKDKNSTMRFMSFYFPKAQMSKVGTIILTQAGLITKRMVSNHGKYIPPFKKGGEPNIPDMKLEKD